MLCLFQLSKLSSTQKPVVCIVGSGPGGGIAAIELARSGKATVIVVDTDRIENPYSQDATGDLDLISSGRPFNQETTRAFGFGGSSNLWHGVLAVLDRADWDLINIAAGRPISEEIERLYGDLVEYFGDVSALFSTSPSVIRPIGKLDRLMLASRWFASKSFLIQRHPLRVRAALRRTRDRCPDLSFLEHATGLHLVASPNEPERAEALIAWVNGERRIVKADIFIIAAGALETPRILLQGDKEGHFRINNAHIGKNLIDHPWTVIGEIVAHRGLMWLGMSDVVASKGLHFRIGYRLRAGQESGERNGNHCIAIKPIFLGQYVSFKDSMKTIISTRMSFGTILVLFKRFSLRDIVASGAILALEKFGIGMIVRRALVFCYLEQPPRSESCVTLSRKKEPSGRSVPNVNWVVGDWERDGVERVKDALSNSMGNDSGFSFVPYFDATATIASGAHHAGTMRIGRNSSEGAIDENLKVFGTANVYISDLSIFPNFGNANPTLTLSAFSLRLARHLLNSAAK